MRKSDAVSHFGTQQKLATAIGKSQSTVAEYPEVLPIGIALLVEKVSEGKVPVDLSLYPEIPGLQALVERQRSGAGDGEIEHRCDEAPAAEGRAAA